MTAYNQTFVRPSAYLTMPFAFPTFRHPPLVTHGTGAIKSLAGGDRWPDTVLFVSGAAPVHAYLGQAWAKAGPALDSIRTVIKPAGEPSWEMCLAAADVLRNARPRRIVAVGGGAVLDGARLAWLIAVDALDANGRLTEQWQERRRHLELVLVPTTCGSGAEAATIAVLSLDGRKVPVVSPALLADEVVLDSRFLSSVDEFTLACSLADALSHAFEAWMSIVPGRLAKEAAISCLRLILSDGQAYDRHARLMDAGFLGGLAAAHCSVGLVHAFAHSIARFGVGHGHANAVALLPGLRRMLARPNAPELLAAIGMTPDGLLSRVSDLIRPALQRELPSPAAAVLADARDRQQLGEVIVADPCMRTSAVTAEDLDMEAWLGEIRDRAPAQC
ncbi:hypothetical protein TBR22_A24060 [Luteitalea sp. TBR-22]|nr:hypothetical protein TBR22_A24060 [Luteitalea sp. TBR-22]